MAVMSSQFLYDIQEYNNIMVTPQSQQQLYMSVSKGMVTSQIQQQRQRLWVSKGMVAPQSQQQQLSVSKEMATPQSQQRLWVSEEVIVFSRGEGGYYCIKIPVLLTTAKGTLIAFGEGRMFSCSDFTWTDLIFKRSIDGGKTWGPLQVLYSNSSMDSGIHTVIGNAAPVVLDSHRILVPFCRNNLQVLLMYSDDDGVNWSKPVNITGVTQPSLTW